MTGRPVIALDVMGGDGGAPIVIAGAELAKRRDPDLRFHLYGRESEILRELASAPLVAGDSEVFHTDVMVAANDKPSQAIRRARNSSMGLAIAGVKKGAAQAAVSAGNTGALMAMAKLSLRTLEGIDRPALAALLPTLGENDLVMLDLGANTECDTENLVQFAVMGAVYARTVLGVDRPRVKLLNIGEEDLKGTDELKEAAALLREATYLPMSFEGFTEGDKLGRGDADVVVTDGFSGNIALKTIEGTARLVTDLLRRSFESSFRSKAGFLLSRPALNMLKVHLDPNNHNGAVFLGLNGLVVKSHGSANETGIANAIGVAAAMVREDITRRITQDLDEFRAHAHSVRPESNRQGQGLQ